MSDPYPSATQSFDSGGVPASAGGGEDSPIKEHVEVARDEAMHLTSSVKDEALAVVGETRRQAGDLLREGIEQVQEQAGAQKGKAVESLRSLGQELATMAQRADAGTAADLTHQASEQVDRLAGWLDQHDPGTLLEEVRGLARRKPGQFLLGAAAAGLLAGRLTRGIEAGDPGPRPAARKPDPTVGASAPSAAPSVVRPAPGQLAPSSTSSVHVNSGTPR